MKLTYKIAFMIGVPCWIVGLFVNPFSWLVNSYNVTWFIPNGALIGFVFWGIGFIIAGIIPFAILYLSSDLTQDSEAKE